MTDQCSNCGDHLDPAGDYPAIDGLTVCSPCLKEVSDFRQQWGINE